MSSSLIDLIARIDGRSVPYRPELTKLTGRITSGILLSQILYWWEKMDEKPFYKTDLDFAMELGFTHAEFKAAKKKLKDEGYITLEKRGLPAKTFYFVNASFILSSLEELRSSSVNKSPELLVENDDSLYIHRVPQESTQERRLPEIMGKTPIARIAFVYSLMYRNRYQEEYRVSNWAALTKAFSPLFKDFSEWQVAALITLHFDWHGASGSDEFIHRKLAEKRFPLEWVPRTINEYRPYFRENLGFPFDDQETIKRHVTSIIKPLYKQQIG